MKYLLVALFSMSSVFAATNVTMQTNMGTIEIELDEAKAPITVKNFLGYVDSRFYDGLIFHRVIKDFMIQGGGFDEKMKEKKTLAPIKNESNNGLSNTTGTISMARTSDPHSASAQFFINTVDNTSLDYKSEASWGYAVFGKVTKGMDVVNRIRMVRTGSINGYGDVPMDTVKIVSIRKK
jgi:cyclophilin family peptidyl-prolyl cis-trans isomerase